jgi:hypothetical protein
LIKVIGIIVGILVAGFVVIASYSALSVASYWDDMEGKND